MKIKIFADGAHLLEIKNAKSWVKGFTTNPTLMRKAGVLDYKSFALEALEIVGDRPISFEVFADDFPGMKAQALEIASWGSNVYVKIPIVNTKGESSVPLIQTLSTMGVQLNVTALFTVEQVARVVKALSEDVPAIISVFAGRIADTGRDPIPVMKEALSLMRGKMELLWASPREILNLMQADEIGCHIITMPNDLLKKMSLLNKDLEDFTLETVQMFYADALASNFDLPIYEEIR